MQNPPTTHHPPPTDFGTGARHNIVRIVIGFALFLSLILLAPQYTEAAEAKACCYFEIESNWVWQFSCCSSPACFTPPQDPDECCFDIECRSIGCVKICVDIANSCPEIPGFTLRKVDCGDTIECGGYQQCRSSVWRSPGPGEACPADDEALHCVTVCTTIPPIDEDPTLECCDNTWCCTQTTCNS